MDTLATKRVGCLSLLGLPRVCRPQLAAFPTEPFLGAAMALSFESHAFGKKPKGPQNYLYFVVIFGLSFFLTKQLNGVYYSEPISMPYCSFQKHQAFRFPFFAQLYAVDVLLREGDGSSDSSGDTLVSLDQVPG